jgi:hypothetical protein
MVFYVTVVTFLMTLWYVHLYKCCHPTLLLVHTLLAYLHPNVLHGNIVMIETCAKS